MLVVVGFLIVAIYLYVNPGTSYLMPKCVFKMITGLDCPSCGGQRALHALLNGQIYESVMFNPFLFVVAPYLLAVLYASLFKNRLAMAVKRITHHHITIMTYLAGYVLWWIIRNTEWWKGL